MQASLQKRRRNYGHSITCHISPRVEPVKKRSENWLNLREAVPNRKRPGLVRHGRSCPNHFALTGFRPLAQLSCVRGSSYTSARQAQHLFGRADRARRAISNTRSIRQSSNANVARSDRRCRPSGRQRLNLREISTFFGLTTVCSDQLRSEYLSPGDCMRLRVTGNETSQTSPV